MNPNITILDEPIEYVSLGLVLDTKLNFSFHINLIISRISFIIRKLYCLGCFLPFNVRKRVAKSLCLPIFLYGVEIYSGTSKQNISRLKLCFNRIVRYIYNVGYRDHISAKVFEILGSDFHSFINQR